ncbi:hypothetical protein PRIPAC_94139 [Pristionchus pacificus]|nr:hypothetical protein PRIPAC_94139 [Pristionchus pacificus]
MANSTEFSLYEFIYPGPDCDVLCILAISIALLIVGFGSIIFVALLIFICFSMPSKKAEKQMKAIREQMRNDWDEKKKAKGEAVKTRTIKKEEHGSNGCDRSSTFQYVNFRDHRERVRFQEDRHSEDIEMQPLTSPHTEHFNPLVRPSTIIIAPPDIVIEHSASLEEKTPVAEDAVDETAHDRFPTYDEVPGDDEDDEVTHLPVPLHAYDKIIVPCFDYSQLLFDFSDIVTT